MDTDTVYSARRKADLVMTSIGNVGTRVEAKINFGDVSQDLGLLNAPLKPNLEKQPMIPSASRASLFIPERVQRPAAAGEALRFSQLMRISAAVGFASWE